MNDKSNDAAQQKMRLQELQAYGDNSRILAHWEPVRYMDSGTFSYIFLVRSRHTGIEAVLKFIPNPKDLLDCRVEGNPENLFHQTRFAAARREAEIMGRFRGNTHVVQYLEEPEYLKRSFVNARGETVRQYAVLICMPLYRNHREWMPRIARDRNARLRLGIEISEALIAFEEKGVYHRDIKPGNILMDDDGDFCLSDVGEAKLESEFTTTGFHGTRPYMAPEVYNQENERKKMHSDHRSDIYSLGIILYRLFNRGQFPFLQESGELTVDARTTFKSYSKKYGSEVNDQYLTDGERARLLRYDGAKLPPPCEADEQLGRVILKACAYRKEDRYATAEALRHDLLCCIEGGKPTGAKRSGSRKTGLIVSGCVLAAVVAAGSVYVVLRQGSVYEKEPASTAKREPEKINQYAYVIQDNTPVRVNPDSNANIQSILDQNMEVYLRQSQIATDSEKWYLVQYGDAGYGYVCADAVRLMEQNAATAAPTDVPSTISTATPSPTPTATPSPTPTVTPSPTPTATPSPTPTATPSPIPTATPSPTPNPTPTKKPVLIKENQRAGNGMLYSVMRDGEGQQYAVITGYEGKKDEELLIPARIEGIPVREIGAKAFSGCSRLTGSLTIPGSVKSIGDFAFAWCSSLTGNLTIPQGVTSIGNGAFWNCSGLTGSLTIPKRVTSIGKDAFYGCRFSRIVNRSRCTIQLAEVMPSPMPTASPMPTPTPTPTPSPTPTPVPTPTPSLIPIPTPSPTAPPVLMRDNQRTEQGILYSVMMDGDGMQYAVITGYEGKENAELSIPAQIEGMPVKEIGINAFNGCCGLRGNLTIPDSVVIIGDCAFSGCTGLRGSLTIPNSVTSIGAGAFSDCSNLTGILTIPDSVTNIGIYAFQECRGLKGSLTIPNSVKSIGDFAFRGCSGLTGSLTISDNVTNIGSLTFYGCRGLTGNLMIPDSVTSIGNFAFYGCNGLTGNLTISDSVTSIGIHAFSGCSGLTGSLIIPEGVTSIGSHAFNHCSGLTGRLTIPDSVTSIGEDAFAGCQFTKIDNRSKCILQMSNAATDPTPIPTSTSTPSPTGMPVLMSDNQRTKAGIVNWFSTQ